MPTLAFLPAVPQHIGPSTGYTGVSRHRTPSNSRKNGSRKSLNNSPSAHNDLLHVNRRKDMSDHHPEENRNSKDDSNDQGGKILVLRDGYTLEYTQGY